MARMTTSIPRLHLATSRILALGVGVAAVLNSIPVAAQQSGGSQLRVISAQRTNEYAPARLRAGANDVVLVLTLDGIGNDEWSKIKPAEIFVMAWTDKSAVLLIVAGQSVRGAGGKAANTLPRIALFKVPRQPLEMTVHLGSRPPVTFTADKAIVPSIRAPEPEWPDRSGATVD